MDVYEGMGLMGWIALINTSAPLRSNALPFASINKLRRACWLWNQRLSAIAAARQVCYDAALQW
jgi:hypothetical protein